MSIIFGTILVILVYAGLISLVYAVMFCLLKPKKQRRKEVLLIPLSSDCEDIQALLHFALIRLALLGDENRVRIVLADMGLNNIQRGICEKFCASHESASICSPEELTEVLNE